MITYLSPPLPVNMGETWFEVASLEHFWIRRRFEVFQKLADALPMRGRIAEFGCGHGLLLQQMAQGYGVAIDGYDLNEPALKLADTPSQRLFHYNIHDRASDLRELYDLIFLFDIIEHLEDDRGFMESVFYHVRPGGWIAINVPANQSLYSKYDKVIGHQRRYDMEMLRELARHTGFTVKAWSYWGFSLIPLLLLRQKLQAGLPENEVARRGFAPPSQLFNRLLLHWSRMEWIPNHTSGASVMALMTRD